MVFKLFFCICRSFESLAEDLTRLLEDRVSGAVRNIYSILGKKVSAGRRDVFSWAQIN